MYIATMDIFYNDVLYHKGNEIPNPTPKMIEMGIVRFEEKIELQLLFDDSCSVEILQ